MNRPKVDYWDYRSGDHPTFLRDQIERQRAWSYVNNLSDETVEVWVNGDLKGIYDDFRAADRAMTGFLNDRVEVLQAEGRETTLVLPPSERLERIEADAARKRQKRFRGR